MESRLALSPRNRTLTLLIPWFVWGVSSLFVTYQMLLQTAPSVMIGDLQSAFSINTFGVSLLSSSFFYTYLLLQIPAGMMVDRVHPRYCLTLCLIGIAIATTIFAYAHSLPVARASRIMQGVFSAPSVVPALYLAAIWFPARRFALLAGLTEMIGMMGAALGQAALAPSVSAYGWRGTLIGCAMVGLMLAVITFFVVREKSEDQPIAKQAAPKKGAKGNVFRDLLTVISYPQAWVNGLFSGLLFAVAAAFGSLWCIPYLMQTYSVSLETAANASAMCLFGVACGAPVIGWVSDRLGLRRLPMILSTAMVLMLMLVVLYVPNINLGLMFVLLFGLGFFSSAYALPFAVMRDIMPENVRGTAMGYTNLMCILIGAPMLQPLIGWLLDSQLSLTANQALAYQHALIVLPISLAVGLVLAFFVQETHCGRKEVTLSP
jgi:MFS family permease